MARAAFNAKSAEIVAGIVRVSRSSSTTSAISIRAGSRSKKLCVIASPTSALTFSFQRLAVTHDDIKRFNLRPLDAKRSDSRYRAFSAEHGDETIELDALPPDELNARIRSAIHRHVDWSEWNRLRKVEQIEQCTIADLASRMGALQ